MSEEVYRFEGNEILNSNNEKAARFEANNIIGELGGGSFEVKSLTYNGTGEEASTVIEFPEKPSYILSMDATMSNGVKLHHYGFTPYEEGSCGLCTWIGGGSGSGGGIYTWNDSTNTLTIIGFSNINERLNTPNMVTTICYI